nr:hypothetical protein GCM10025730_05560 [Promicromonospora thailandica]
MARIGLAASDPDGLVATPVETVPRVLAGGGGRGQAPRSAEGTTADVARIVAEAADRFAVVVYVGLPRHLSGKEGAATADARAFAGRLVAALEAAGEGAQVRLVDERMTTVSAHQALRTAGRKTKQHRSVIDQAAAVIILQSALDAERAKGSAPARSSRRGPCTTRTSDPSSPPTKDSEPEVTDLFTAPPPSQADPAFPEPRSARRAQRRRKKRRGRSLAVLFVALVLVGGAGYAVWTNLDSLMGLTSPLESKDFPDRVVTRSRSRSRRAPRAASWARSSTRPVWSRACRPSRTRSRPTRTRC